MTGDDKQGVACCSLMALGLLAVLLAIGLLATIVHVWKH